jgi:hypothetical protein
LEKDQSRLIRHEKIHFKQQVELLFVGHWILYGVFYLASRYKRHRHYIAYRYNPFEIEAYENDIQQDYLKKRTPFAWLKYMRPYSHVLTGKAAVVPSKKKAVTFE